MKKYHTEKCPVIRRPSSSGDYLPRRSCDWQGAVSQTAIEGSVNSPSLYHRSVEIEGQSIFYREAGSKNSPTLLLLHGFPTSSHMFLDYGSNPPLYPECQQYLRGNQPPTLIVWGKNDVIFPADGAHPYERDLTNLEFHLLDTGHFALEEDGNEIALRIRNFLARNVGQLSKN